MIAPEVAQAERPELFKKKKRDFFCQEHLVCETLVRYLNLY